MRNKTVDPPSPVYDELAAAYDVFTLDALIMGRPRHIFDLGFELRRLLILLLVDFNKRAFISKKLTAIGPKSNSFPSTREL